MQEERDRAGPFFLKQRGRAGIWQIYWYDPAARQTTSTSTGTADRARAREALAEHFYRYYAPPPRADAALTEVLQTYFIKHAQFLPSAAVQRAAMRDALQVWDDPNVNELDRDKQLELVKVLRARPLSDWTILGRLNRIWAAINWAHRGKLLTQVPAQITAADWKPYLPDNEQTYSLEELAALFTACKPKEARYSREHWRRYLILAIGTCGRVTALLELTWSQVDPRLGRIRLNPSGRRQNNKRRATVPICPTLAAELAAWPHDHEHLLHYYGKPLATREFYDLLAQTAGVTGGTNTIRHTVRTWLAEVGVPDAEADAFMGHKGEGSATGARYKHRRPEYLKTVTEGLELLFEKLADLIERPFAGRELEDQPDPSSSHVESEVAKATCKLLNLERETRLELATPTLARPGDPK